MKKNWSNPELKGLSLEETYSEYPNEAYVQSGTDTLDIESAINSETAKCVWPVAWKYWCPCCGVSNLTYETPWGAAIAFKNHWKSAHPQGCKLS